MNSATSASPLSVGTKIPSATPSISTTSASPVSSVSSVSAASSSSSMISPSSSNILSTPSSVPSSSSLTSPSSSYSSSGSDDSFWTSYIFLGIVGILFLAILGFNIFTYLSDGTTMFTKNAGPALSSATGGISTFFNNLFDTAESGGKGFIEVISDTLKSAASIPDKVVKGSVVSNDKTQQINNTSAENAGSVKEKTTANPSNNLQKKIDSSDVKPAVATKQPVHTSDNNEPEPDEVSSSTNSGKSMGFCYIGEESGSRSCISVDESTKCMSGDIFDTKEQCMYPN